MTIEEAITSAEKAGALSARAETFAQVGKIGIAVKFPVGGNPRSYARLFDENADPSEVFAWVGGILDRVGGAF